jgi:hypothetical protein
VLAVWWNRAIFALLQLMTAPSNSGRSVQKLTYLAGFVSGSSRFCLGSFQLISGKLEYSWVHHQAKGEGKVIEMSRLQFAENVWLASLDALTKTCILSLNEQDAKAVGPFTPAAELANGRAAMMGFLGMWPSCSHHVTMISSGQFWIMHM